MFKLMLYFSFNKLQYQIEASLVIHHRPTDLRAELFRVSLQ